MAKLSFTGCVMNKEAYISDSILCLTNQTEQDIEILFYDDGSTDDTCSIIEHYQKEDKRIRLIKGKKNVGLGIAWNRVTKEVKAPILAVISGDDIWEKDRAALTLKAFEKDIDVFYGAFWNCDAQMNKLEWKPTVPFNKKLLLTPRADGFSTQYIPHFVAAIKTKVALKVPYNEKRRWGVDYDFFVDLSKGGYKFGHTDRPLGCARILKSGVSIAHRQEIVEADHKMEKENMR